MSSSLWAARINRRKLPPVETGLRGRCPQCGEGALFKGFLSFHESCEGCGADFSIEDAGDGPTVFVIFIVGILIVPMALGFSMIAGVPIWLTYLIWIPIIIMVSLFLLRLLRGVMFNLQWRHDAVEIKSSEIEHS
jgi:uncharacterized protein (DUF983 family)